MSNENVCPASLVPQTKYFRIIAGFFKCKSFVLYSIISCAQTYNLFLIHKMQDSHVHLKESFSIPFIVSQAEYIL